MVNAADYFRKANKQDGNAKDPRLREAIEYIRDQQQPDGTWIRQHNLQGKVWFEIDSKVGTSSKWLTLIGLRILKWWNSF